MNAVREDRSISCSLRWRYKAAKQIKRQAFADMLTNANFALYELYREKIFFEIMRVNKIHI